MGYAAVATHETEHVEDAPMPLEPQQRQLHGLHPKAQENGDPTTFLARSESVLSTQTKPNSLVPPIAASVLSTNTIKSKNQAQEPVKAGSMDAPQRFRTFIRALALVGVAVVLVGILVGGMKFSKSKQFEQYVHWFDQHPWTGGLLYVSAFCLWTVCCLPSTAWEILAGTLFDSFLRAILLATCGKLSGCVISFVIGKYLCRDRVCQYMEQSRHAKVFGAFRQMLRKNQVVVVVLTRLAFFPIALKNYGLSALDVSFEVFVVASFLTGMGFTLVWVSIGTTARHMGSWYLHDQDTKLTSKLTIATLTSSSSDASKLASQKTKMELLLMAIGALSACVLIAVVGYFTKRQLLEFARAEELAQADDETGTDAEDETETETENASTRSQSVV